MRTGAVATKKSYLLTPLTFLPWLSYGPGMRPPLTLLGLFRSRALLHLEILALRQQLAMVKQARLVAVGTGLSTWGRPAPRTDPSVHC